MGLFRSILRSSRYRAAFLITAGLLVAGLAYSVAQSVRLAAPETVVREYVTNVYAREYRQVYHFLSAKDKEYKSLEEYLRENSSFTGHPLEVSRKLASYIQFDEIQVDKQGDHATATVDFVIPDGNSSVVREILFTDENELTKAELHGLLGKLDRLYQEGQIPTIKGQQSFELVRENGSWRIFENWAEAIRVHFSSEVKNGLPWEFEPVQEVVLAKPGETVRAVYRAKNSSHQSVTAKARHIDGPQEYINSLNIIQCFCLIQQTLGPGEEMEMPVVFRVAWDVAPEVKDFYILYEYYPIESFPEDED
jgi:hypothetical protein